MESIYEIIEENVDGCGTEARVYVASPTALNPEEELLLKECLDDVKGDAADKDWNTEDMVDEALEQFRKKTGRELDITVSPITSMIMF